MRTNLSYALLRTMALIAFALPIVVTMLPQGWENVTLGLVFHSAMTWLNEYIHAPTTTGGISAETGTVA